MRQGTFAVIIMAVTMALCLVLQSLSGSAAPASEVRTAAGTGEAASASMQRDVRALPGPAAPSIGVLPNALPFISAEAEFVPASAAQPAGLPAPALWPPLRHERRLRLLYLGHQGASVAAYQRLARRIGARLDLVFTAEGGDQNLNEINTLIHTNDVWIEAKKNPSAKEVSDYANLRYAEVFAHLSGNYDVVFCNGVRSELQGYVEQGGIWVVDAPATPKSGSPFVEIWPVTPKLNRGNPQNSWHDKGAERGDAIELAGLPLARLSGWQWHALYDAAPGAQALATGQCGATFLRRLGKGALVFVPTGPISRTTNVIERIHRTYDHDEIWLRYWDQFLHSLVGGDAALPVMADLRLGEGEASSGRDYVLPGRLVNRSKQQRQLVVSLHVLSPAGAVVYAGAPQDVTLAPNESRDWKTAFPVAADWPAGLYPVYLTVGDPAAKKQLHQAMELVPVAGSIKLTLKADKPGYRLGERATFTLEPSSTAPWQGELRWAVHDFRGRTLGAGVMPASLDAQPKAIPFTWNFADHGVRVDAVWTTAVAVKDGKECARAECKVYKHERWNMRNEYQWSTWPRMAGGPPSLVPQAMRLMAHAGFNALGYPAGGKEIFYPAERWGWRIYNEGAGSNTWSPVIESVTDEEIEAAQRKAMQKPDADIKSAALVLASVGEEAGFKSGWGRTYYWDEPVAPDVACRAFQRFLKERYPSIQVLNAAWGTSYRAWGEIKLTKEFSGKTPTLAADGWAHPSESPIGQGAPGVTLAPFTDTRNFYAWYYDKVVAAAQKILRAEVNPVPRTMASAPGSRIFDPPSCEVRGADNGGWVESQKWSVSASGRDPAFGMAWGHFDWPVATENVLWGFVISRSGHNNYWVDIPMHFNPDMTPTRAAWAIRRWRERTRHAERLILDAMPAPAEAGVLGPSGSFPQQTPTYMADSVKVALNQGGFGFAHGDFENLRRHKVVLAVFLNSISKEHAAALGAYVENGGTLVIGPRLAGQDEHGVAQKIVPGHGLAEKWGLQVTIKKDNAAQQSRRPKSVAPLDQLGPALAGTQLESDPFFIEQVSHQGWTSWATYPDQTPALLTRSLGKGRLVYLNAAYQSNWYIQSVTPTGRARQGFYRLIEKLCLDAGVGRAFRIDGNPSQTLHVAALQWQDPSGEIRYAVTRTHGQTIWTSGTLNWLGPQTTCYDVLGGDPTGPAPVFGTEIAFNFRPGAGRLLAFIKTPITAVKASVTTPAITTGESVSVKVEILDAAGRAVPGKFPLDIRVFGPAGEITGLRRDLSMASGESVNILTALNDPPGEWHVVVRDGISRLEGKALVTANPAAAAKSAPGFRPWGWPSEHWEPERMPASEFVGRLKQLSEVYRKDHTSEQWLAKQWLGAHYCFFPGTRHDLTQNLLSIDWTRYADTIKQAVTGGEHLILVGEDLGLDPATGIEISPYGNGRQLEAVAAAMREATWETLTGDGETVRASLGKGSLVLCRNTPDGASSSWGWASAWQKQLLAALRAASGGRFPAPDTAKLTGWLTGREILAIGPRTVIWQGGWEAVDGNRPVWRDEAWTVALEPAGEVPGPVFVLRLPPTGNAKKTTIELTTTGNVPVAMDIGADGRIEAEDAADKLTAGAWADAINQYLTWRGRACGGIERDLNGWRLVPIRFGSGAKVGLTVNRVKVEIE